MLIVGDERHGWSGAVDERGERAFGSADFGATLRGVDMHLKALGEVVRLHGDSRSLYFGAIS